MKPMYEAALNCETQNQVLNINGSKYLFNSTLTISQLMDYLGFNSNVIVLDYNGVILEKILWERTFLANEDNLEILSIAGGG